MRVSRILRVGSLVFGFSSALLIFMPSTFNSLLGLQSNDNLEWAMRMIGITVLALAGNLFLNSLHSERRYLRRIGWIMCLSALALAICTLVIPVELTWFSYFYAGIGASFSISYAYALMKKRY